VSTTTSYIAHISDSEKIEWAGTVLRAVNPKADCKRIKQVWNWNNSGIYEINPTWTALISVYCDMDRAWGGWTLVARSVVWWTGTFNLTSNNWMVTNLNAAYTLNTTNLNYTNQLFTAYTSDRTIDKSKETLASPISLVSSPHTLAVSWITGWVASDGYNAKQWMLFVK
jgi:hypothetical protein